MVRLLWPPLNLSLDIFLLQAPKLFSTINTIFHLSCLHNNYQWLTPVLCTLISCLFWNLLVSKGRVSRCHKLIDISTHCLLYTNIIYYINSLLFYFSFTSDRIFQLIDNVISWTTTDGHTWYATNAIHGWCSTAYAWQCNANATCK